MHYYPIQSYALKATVFSTGQLKSMTVSGSYLAHAQKYLCPYESKREINP